MPSRTPAAPPTRLSVHDADASDDKRNRSDGDKKDGESLAGFELCLDDVFWIADIEIVFLLRAEMVAVAENSGSFLTGRLDVIPGNSRAENVIKPGNAFDFFLRSRVRKHDYIDLVLARKGQTFRKKTSHDFAGKIVDANDLADGVLGAKQLIANGAAHGADIGSAIDVVLGEDGTLIDEPAPDFEVFGGNTSIAGLPILIAVDDVDGVVNVRGHAFDERNLILDGNGVGYDEGCR